MNRISLIFALLKLSKREAFVYIFLMPFVLNVSASIVTDSVVVKYMMTFLQSLLLCLWYYNVFEMSYKQEPVTRTIRVLTIGSLIFVGLSSLIGLVQDDRLSNIFAALDVLGILIILYSIPYSFSKALKKKGIQFDSFFLYVSFIVYPVAIWRYHERIREWGYSGT